MQKGSLTPDGYAVAEGFHLLEEALRSECAIKSILASESVHQAVLRHVQGLRRIHFVRVADELFPDLSSAETPQGVIALVKPPAWDLEHLFRGNSLVVVLDGIQDPGNAGAILRSAEAFGATGAVILKGTVSPYNPKALRASAGSVFRLPLISGLDEALASAALEQRRIDVYAAMPTGGRLLHDVDLTRRCAFVIGSEGRGVGQRLRSIASDISIPVVQVESLNASLAAGILLYEARRQRQVRA